MEILSLIGDETVIDPQRAKVYVFSDSVLSLGKVHQHPESNEAWKKRIEGITTDKSCRDYDGINGEPTEFEWNIFSGFTTLQLSEKVKSLLYRLGETPETFTGRILFVSMFNDISCGTRDNEQECLANARLVSLYARRFGKGQWSFIGPGSDKKWSSIKVDSPQGIWDQKVEKMVEFAEADVQFPVLQLHCPGVSSKAKDMRFTMQPTRKRLRLFFAEFFLQASSVFTEQSQRCVKNTNPFTKERGDLL